MPGLETRRIAARLLGLVVHKRHALDGLIDAEGGNPGFLALDPRDRSLARAIVKVALRHRNGFESVLTKHIERPLPPGTEAVGLALHVALAQILVLDVPDRAAVDLAVAAVKADRATIGFAGLVNAVLRKIAGPARAEAEATLAATPLFPDWFATALQSAWGAERTTAIDRICRHEAPLDLGVKTGAEGVAASLGGITLLPGHVRLPAAPRDITALEGFDTGDWFVQDIAAGLPARLFGDLTGKCVADLCAAPGGKTAQLILAGGIVTAFEEHRGRMKRLKANLGRLGLSCETVLGDFRQTAKGRSFDTILLDAPCSSTGTVRRHADVAWVKSAEQIEALARLQRTLLDAALPLLAPGGVLVYSNCSLLPQEGEDMIAELLADLPASHPDIAPDPIAMAGPDWLASAVNAQGQIRTTPDMLPAENPAMAGLDGFFACRFRRKA